MPPPSATTAVPAAAFFACQRRPRYDLANVQHVPKVKSEMPARVELHVSGHRHATSPLTIFIDLSERFFQVILGADNPDQILHRRSEFLVNGKRVLTAFVAEGQPGTVSQ